MLETCADLRACEEALVARVPEVNLLGEIPIRRADLDRLEQLITENLHLGMPTLERATPHSLACYLTGKGIYHYASESGDYWSSVRDTLGISSSAQNRLGSFFRAYLSKNEHLINLDIPGAHIFVAPILLHALIPVSCLDEYFGWFTHWISRSGLTDADERELICELELIRDNHHRHREETDRVNNLRSRRRAAQIRVDHLTKLLRCWEDLEFLAHRGRKIDHISDDLGDLPDDPRQYLHRRQRHLEELDAKIGRLETEAGSLSLTQATFGVLHRRILQHEEEILSLQDQIPEIGDLRRRIQELEEIDRRLRRKMAQLTGGSDSCDPEVQAVEIELDELTARIELLKTLDSEREKLSPARRTPLHLAAGLGLLAGSLLSPVIAIPGILLTLWSASRMPSWQRLRRITTEQDDLVLSLCERFRALPAHLRQAPTGEIIGHLRLVIETHRSLEEGATARQEIRTRLSVIADQVETAARYCGVTSDTDLPPEKTIGRLAAHLEDARTRSQVAAAADQKLRERVKPRIEQLQIERDHLEREHLCVRSRISALGEGDFERGIENLRAHRHCASRVEALRGQIDRNLISLHRRETEAERGRADVESEIRDCLQQVGDIEEELQNRLHWVESYRCPLRYLSHPVQRFITEGNTAAGRLLCATQKMLRGESCKELLPPHVIEGFDTWNLKREKEDRTETARSRLMQPQIRFLPDAGEIAALCPTSRLQMDDVSGMRLRIETERQSLTFPLELFREGDLWTVQECTVPLPPAASRYTFHLLADHEEVTSWEEPLPAHFMAFSHPDGRHLGRELPPERMWVVLPTGWSVRQPRVIAEEAMSGQWADQHCFDIDAADAEEVILRGPEDHEVIIPLVSAPEIDTAQLTGGRRVDGIRCDGLPVYGVAPRLTIPAETREELQLWDITIIPHAGDPVRLNPAHLVEEEGSSYSSGLQGADISLAHWTESHPVQSLIVKIHRRGQWLNSFQFAVIAGLSLAFDEPLYLPSSGRANYGVKMATDEQVTLKLAGEARLLDMRRDSGHMIADVRVSRPEGTVSGSFSPEDASPDLPFTIRIPRIRWCLMGSDDDTAVWHDAADEVWHEDLGHGRLFVQMPASVSGRVRLTLREARQSLDGTLRDGRVEFDLSAFSDSLRESSAAISHLDISVTSCEVAALREGTELLCVRTRWEAEGIECVQVDDGPATSLQVRWTAERGRATARAVRLWHRGSRRPVKEAAVRRGRREAVLDLGRGVSPGEYRVEVAAVEADEWGAQPPEPHYPADGSPGVLDIRIRPPEELATGDRIKLHSVRVGHRSARETPLRLSYQVRILGRIINQSLPVEGYARVKPVNEGWYVGKMSIRNLKGFRPPVNPVKMEISNGWITAIEDRQGDGAVFCSACQLMFWAQEDQTKELLRGHRSFLKTEDLYIAYSQ